MDITSFEQQARGWLPDARFFYESPPADAIERANVDLGMFFRTGTDLCTMQVARYAGSRVPRFVMAESAIANAFAVWNDKNMDVDWVIVTTALISRLVILGQVVATYFAKSQTFRAELAFLHPLIDELDSEEAIELLGLSLTQLGFIFVVGHELGHHACGHERIYRGKKANSASAAVDEAWITRQSGHAARLPGRQSIEPDLTRQEMDFQALEMAADHCGVEVLMQNVVRLMRRVRQDGFAITGNCAKANRVMQQIFVDSTTAVFVASSSLVLAFVAFKAGEWEVRDMTNVEHPLPSVRAFAMIELIQATVLPDDVATPKVNRQGSLWGPLSHVAMPVAASVFSMPMRQRNAREFVRNKWRAWKLLGISRAALTPRLMPVYLSELRRRWSIQRQQCKSAWRYDEPGPIVDESTVRS